MKKKIVLLSVGGLVITSAIALSLFAIAGQSSLDLKATDDYSITIHPEDITTATSWASGSATVKTDQLKNDVTFKYANILWSDAGSEDGLYLQGNGAGKIYNEIGHEVRGMTSIVIKGANDPFNVKWGFKEGDEIVYVDSDWEYASPTGYTYNLNGNEPNYFMIESGTGTDCLLYEIVISYGKDCVEKQNPYKVVNGVKYFKNYSQDVAYVMGFDAAPVENLVIPSSIDGFPVTQILVNAFYGETTIKTVSLPNTIEELNSGSFRNCTSLTSVTFATGGTEDLTIRDDVFRNTAITTLTLPKRLDYIEPTYSLLETDALTSINIEDDYSSGNYKTVDGVLYRNDPYEGAELIHYPANSIYPNFNVPTDVYKVHEYSCQNTKNLKILTFNNQDALLIDAYAFGNDSDNSSIEHIYFQGPGVVTLYWNPFRGYEGDIVLHDDTIIDARGLGQMSGNSRVFFEATEIPGNWSADWAVSKNLTAGADVKFYLYSETTPAGVAPTNIDGFWHYVADEPTVW